jgi:Zn-dependent peptidase ImmA (M78 family)
MRKSRRSIEEQAQALLNELNIRSIPVPLERIARALGARLSFSPLDEELSGMIYIKNSVPIIGVNSLHHPHRQRFTLAHEIAHLHLHRDQITHAVHVDKRFAETALRRDGRSSKGVDEKEIEANQFAAALLVPMERLLDELEKAELDVEDERALDDLARRFKVSKATLQYRIRNLAIGKIPRPQSGKRLAAAR